MAIKIDELHDFIRGTIKKNYGGFVSPVDIDRAIKRASFDLFDSLVESYKKTEEFDYDHLFLKRTDISIATSDNGVASLPSDYSVGVGFYYKDSSNNLYEGNLLKWDTFMDRNRSSISPPVINTSTAEYRPIGTIYDKKVEFAPRPSSGTHNFVLVYFKEPKEGVYGYTESSGVITVNRGTCVDLDWDKRSFSDISNRALTYLGFPIKDAEIMQLESVVDSNQIRDVNN